MKNKKERREIISRTFCPYSEEEINILYNYYTETPMEELLVMLPNRNAHSITIKARKLGLSKYKTEWSEDEIRQLTDMLEGGASAKDVSDVFGKTKTKNSLKSVMKQFGLHYKRDCPWTSDEIDLLKELYPDHTSREIASYLPKRNEKGVGWMAKKLGLQKDPSLSYGPWSEEEDQMLLDLYQAGYDFDEIVQLMGTKRSVNALRTRIRPMIEHRTFWTKAEWEYLRDNYSHLSISELQNVLNRSENAIQKKIDYLKLHNNETPIKSEFFYGQKSIEEISYKSVAKKSYPTLSAFLRGHSQEWEHRCRKNSNGKCVLSGESENVELHHLMSMSKLIDMTLFKVNIPVKQYIDYTEQELSDILYVFRQLLYSHPDAVVLSKSIHRQFHYLYGYKDNSPEQFEEFKKQYFKQQSLSQETAGSIQ